MRLEKERINPIYHFNNGSGRKKYIKGIDSYDILAHVGINHRRCIFNATEQIQRQKDIGKNILTKMILNIFHLKKQKLLGKEKQHEMGKLS